MRGWPAAVALFAVLPLTGCVGDGADGCGTLRGQAVVQQVSGNDAHVLLDDGQPAVLHLPPEVYVLEGSQCTLTGPPGVRVGDRVSFEVDAWAESYPMQGWPERVVVLR